MAQSRLFLIDSFGFIFRAYHARARSADSPMRTSSGLSTEAVFIFGNMVRKLMASYHPEYTAAVFETEGPTFREQAFTDYKANRPAMPADLAEQIPYVRRVLEGMRIPVLEYTGFEADDVIGTIARQGAAAGVEVVIVSSDKDMMQLIGDRIRMLNPAKEDLWYDPEKVVEFLGVRPEQVTDLLALKGDAVDNIPGAPGIGDKGARELIVQFGSVEATLDRAGEVQRKTYRESLQNHREQILLSKHLATIDAAVPIEWNLDSLATRSPDADSLRTLYKELEFFSLLKELEPAPVQQPRDYRELESGEAVASLLAELPACAPVAVAVRLGASGELLSSATIGLAVEPGKAVSVSEGMFDLLRPLLEDPERAKTAHDITRVLLALARSGIEGRGFTEDPMLYAFLISADPAACSAEAAAARYLDRKLGPSVEEHADCALQLSARLGPQVDSRGLRGLYESLDLPLTPVLARMGRHGIRVEPAALASLSRHMQAEHERLTAEIHTIAGHPFNINSPQQLGKVLFEEMNLPVAGRTGKTKSYSTAADVLEGLAGEHPIAGLALEYRQITKLKGTYVDALPQWIDPSTGRLHTTFNAAGAATGRLSSSDPNLQNIPVRTELGRKIRAAFVPEAGWKLLVADYSQIELRLLAHMSRDPVLTEAFRHGEDIHTRTAAEVFGTPPLMVTPEQRRDAKAVNFGIVYGLSAFGLAAQLGISRKEAEHYIASYFERYAGVRKFLDETIAEVRQTGTTRTLFGRLRPIPDINSRNPNARGFAERTAVNTPLQGTAADLIKLAMIHIDARLSELRLRTRMLLQVHDELVFEAPPEEIEPAAKLIKHEMERVHALEVPLVVDIGVGDNWRDAK